jgi:hypothetical protein
MKAQLLKSTNLGIATGELSDLCLLPRDQARDGHERVHRQILKKRGY